jgi:hypothetical protein
MALGNISTLAHNTLQKKLYNWALILKPAEYVLPHAFNLN